MSLVKSHEDEEHQTFLWRMKNMVNLGYLHRCCAGPIHWTVKSDQSLSAPNLEAQGVKPTADSADAQQSVGVGVLGWLGIDGSWEDLGGSGRVKRGEKPWDVAMVRQGAETIWNVIL